MPQSWFLMLLIPSLLVLAAIGVALSGSTRAHRKLVHLINKAEARLDSLHLQVQQNHGEVRAVVENVRQNIERGESTQARLENQLQSTQATHLQRLEQLQAGQEQARGQIEAQRAALAAMIEQQQNQLQWLHDRLAEQNTLHETLLATLQGGPGAPSQHDALDLWARLNVLSRTLEPAIA